MDNTVLEQSKHAFDDSVEKPEVVNVIDDGKDTIVVLGKNAAMKLLLAKAAEEETK